MRSTSSLKYHSISSSMASHNGLIFLTAKPRKANENFPLKSRPSLSLLLGRAWIRLDSRVAWDPRERNPRRALLMALPPRKLLLNPQKICAEGAWNHGLRHTRRKLPRARLYSEPAQGPHGSAPLLALPPRKQLLPLKSAKNLRRTRVDTPYKGLCL